MRWQGRRGSNNIEDRRGQSGGLGGLGGFRIGGKGGIIMLLVVLVAGYYGIDLTPLLDSGQSTDVTQSSYQAQSPEDEKAAEFTSVTLALTEDSWSTIFRQMGKTYTPPKLVMYNGATRTGCGVGQSVMGPFYCPADRTVYIDLGFYQDMYRLGGGGDFAQAYVIAHEVGHHVQNLLGIADKVRQLQQSAMSEKQANQLSVRLELQADCFAGVWGATLKDKNVLENGDVEKALKTAQAIGDDRLQRQAQGRVIPDSFTHGTSEQRYSWFKRGFESGDIAQCDTFNGTL